MGKMVCEVHYTEICTFVHTFFERFGGFLGGDVLPIWPRWIVRGLSCWENRTDILEAGYLKELSLEEPGEVVSQHLILSLNMGIQRESA